MALTNPLQAIQLSTMEKDVLLYGDISVEKSDIVAPASVSEPINHPDDDLWKVLSEPFDNIRGKIGDKEHIISIKYPILIFNYKSNASIQEEQRLIHVFSGTKLVNIYTTSNITSQKIAPSPNTEALMSAEVPSYWASILHDFLSQETNAPAPSGISTVPSSQVIANQTIEVFGVATDSAKKSGIATAHFSLLKEGEDPKSPEAKQKIADCLYAITRAPGFLEGVFLFLKKNLFGDLDPTIDFRITINQNEALRVIYETNNITTIVEDGCIKTTGTWVLNEEIPGNIFYDFVVINIEIAPWGEG